MVQISAVLALVPILAIAPPHALEHVSGLGLELVASGFDQPVHLASPPGDPRLFVVEQAGRIRIIAGGRVLAPPFLDLSELVSTGSERGLLSVAFHPDYSRNRTFFVNYTDRDGHTQIVRYRASAASNLANPASARRILTVRQPYSNHNGGMICFGPDSMLYVGMGDGGGAGDPRGHARNLGSLLGKLLRIDVDRGDPYAIPPDNPFVGRSGARPEIWAYGLRNPWRFGFDPAESLLYVADVGQNEWEEIDVVPARASGLDFGWNDIEGRECYRHPDCDRSHSVEPLLTYDHGQGCSVTGGAVYRGQSLTDWVGHYVYADYCSGWIRSFRVEGGRLTRHRQWRLPIKLPVSSFGRDAAGELYVVSHRGSIYRVVPAR